MRFFGIIGGCLNSALSRTGLALLLTITVSALAMDCSVSKEFHVAQPQVLSGALKDPSGAVISGLQIELLAGRRCSGNSGRVIRERLTLRKYPQEDTESGSDIEASALPR